MAGTPLIKMVNVEETGFPIPECIAENQKDILECYTASNLTKYFKAPMFLVESPYDAYSIENIVYTKCQENQRPPFSIQNCNQTTRDAIEEYRKGVFEAIKKIKSDRKNIGLWAPACAQHGFTDTDTFTDKNFRIPSGEGPMVSEAIQ